MAQLDIQKKQGVNPLWWILGLIAVALVAWWIYEANDRDDRVVADAATMPAAVAASDATMPVSDIATITGAATPLDLVGRTVRLTDVPVLGVVSDKGYWVGSDEAQRVFVVRSNQASSRTPADGAVDAGQRVSLVGVIQQMPANLTQDATDWNIRSTDVSTLQRYPVYVREDSLTITSR